MSGQLKAILRETSTGRYAPSPTGDLHLGNLRTALAAQQDIRERGGTFILRMEDTDLLRNRAGAASGIIEDLAWLGITFDEGPHLAAPGGPAGPYTQSQRHKVYLQALAQLAAAGLIYPCSCSRQMLESSASAPHGPETAQYPGTCRRQLTPAQADAMLQAVSHASLRNTPTPLPWSVRINTARLAPVKFYDELHGTQQWEMAAAGGDFVLFRRDGLWAYQLVCAVDDALMGISRVVRGQDLLSSTPRQVALMQALEFPAPVYRHLPLAADPETGRRLTKRDGSFSLKRLRQQGCTPKRAIEIITNLPELAE